MRYCEKCKADVAGPRKICPLCQGPLIQRGEDSPEVFPLIPTMHRQHGLFFRLLIFITAAAGIIAVTLNMMFPQSGWWSFFVVAGICCLWISLAIAVKKRRNIPKNILYQVVSVSVLTVLWDCVTGWRGWSLDYVIPIVCVAAMVVMAVISRVMPLYVDDYMIYVIIDAVFGILTVVFYGMGWLSVPYPSLICVAVSVISLVALFVFEGENMLMELRKRFHL